MAQTTVRPIHIVLGEARRELGMSQHDFGYAVGASHRTAVRWDARQAHPAMHHLRKLAELLLPHDRDLAAEVASHAGETLVSLGLEQAPAAADAVPPPRDLDPRDIADILVCAGAEATGMSPAAVRPVIHLIFKRARQVGLDVATVEKALEPFAATKNPTR